jgi:hypothetical protein
MPSKSPAQHRLMQAAAHTKGGFGGVPQKVGKEFVEADKGRTMKKANGGSTSPYDYDSDVDYYRAIGRLKDEDNEPQEAPRISSAVLNKQKTMRRKNAADSAMSMAAKRAGDKDTDKKIQDRWFRREQSEKLKIKAKTSKAPIAESARKEWSEKIGKGKPAPFKTGGKAKSCW